MSYYLYAQKYQKLFLTRTTSDKFWNYQKWF
jgi:hypothetical protein